ncbi:MAG: signal recognition particle protein [Waddliaceae bacterium]
MFGIVTEKFQDLFSKIAGKKKLTEENIREAVSEVRLALLEADVNYRVVKGFVKKVKERAEGADVIKSVSPGQQFIKIVHDELVELMGGEAPEVKLKHKPTVIMMCGLQGSGKTTNTAKLANYFVKNKKAKQPYLIACDLQRPAAIEQLQILGKQLNIPVYANTAATDPVRVAREGLEAAKAMGADCVIVDTAGRLHIDESLMDQLQLIKDAVQPNEILFVANAATGQDAVNVAKSFHDRMEITGTILTMLDGSTRGGAAISIREVTGKPLLFEGVGEKIDDIQPFNPASMADRILGMGDTINLVRKAKEHMDEGEAKDLEKKIRTATFTFEDYLSQIQMVKKMGSLKGLFSMLPGASKLNELNIDDKEFFKIESIILSMTPSERTCDVELTVPRRKRISDGSGTKLDDVNRLVKSFKQSKQFFKKMPNMKSIEKMMGGKLWR